MFAKKAKKVNNFQSHQETNQIYDVALSWYQKAAERGQVKAQNHLGWMYQNGYGVTRNYARSVEWYQKAANQNDRKGQNNLGLMYAHGLGVSQNDLIAVQWYQKSAVQEYAEAQYNLGFMYEHGRGVDQNYSLAVELYKKAAIQENTNGQYRLGLMYEYGYGVFKNDIFAVEYYQQAVEQEHAEAQYRLGLMCENGRGMSTNLDLAFQLYQKAADQGEAGAQYRLGLMYEHGRGTYKNNSLARLWYQKSAEQNNINAKERLKMGILRHEFVFSRIVNEPNRFFDNGDNNIPEQEKYLSATIFVKYVGSIDIGDRIILKQEIHNPYKHIYSQVMTETNSDSTYYPTSTVEWFYFLFIPIWGCRIIAETRHKEKLELIKRQYDKFWQQKTEELLKQADEIVEQRISDRMNIIVQAKQHKQEILKTYKNFQVEYSDDTGSLNTSSENDGVPNQIANTVSFNLPNFNMN